ncbi:MAG: hypothetical protein CBD88_07255 [Flavobacteriales bacterium TMED228]|nr:MAG: hypothetical protein CBD88_07255 [Flavobacteriales bacterium TMED228]|tara:strand:+ start:155 stop:457 length:303 start_codon:yes stop_codon:yes gene_type:complete
MTFEQFQASRKKHNGHFIYLPTNSEVLSFDSSRDHTNYWHIEIVKDPEPYARNYLMCKTATGDVIYEAIIDRATVSDKSLEVVEKALYKLLIEWGEIDAD